jgi:acetyl esterase/lipase
MDAIFGKHQGAPWLIRTETDPDAAASAKARAEMVALRGKYPMLPGSEMVYLDDTTPAGLTRRDYKAGNNNLFLYTHADTSAAEKRLVSYVHGGGFVRGNGKYCRVNAFIQAASLGLPVATGEYRTAPEAKEPLALGDVEGCYHYLVDTLGYDPAQMIFTGDSAGGCLAMGLCHRLKAQGRPLPLGIALYSPCLDLSLAHPSHVANLGKDLFFPTSVAPFIPNYAPDASRWKEPEVSPYWGDFTGFPPTYFCADDSEAFLSDSLETAAKMHRQGVPVQCHVFHGLWHTFPVAYPPVSAGAVVFKDIRAFLGL